MLFVVFSRSDHRLDHLPRHVRLGHAHPGEIPWYRHPYPDPGDGQATRDAIDTALTTTGTGRKQAAAC
jgi:hypothetical protein